MSKFKHHVARAKRHASKHFPRVKKTVKRVYRIWQLIVLLFLSAVLIPVFLSGSEHNIYQWLIPFSVAIYLILTVIHLRLKQGFVKNYLETTATRLFLGMVALTASFLCFGLGIIVWAKVLLVASAVLYAAFVQQISFLRVIGL